MITCPVCHTSNHHLAAVCTSCGGFLQTRQENLDLFATVWKLVESPIKAYRAITIARHKNNLVLLSCLAGCALTFFLFWMYNLGDHSESLLNLLLAGLSVGPFFGMVVVGLAGFFVYFLSKLASPNVSYRNSLAVVAYSCVPIIISFVLIFPLELMTFGLYLFTKNPSPYQLRPTSYLISSGLDGMFGVWSIVLACIGVRVMLDVPWLKAILIVLGAVALLGGGVLALGALVIHF